MWRGDKFPRACYELDLRLEMCITGVLMEVLLIGGDLTGGKAITELASLQRWSEKRLGI